LNKFQLSLFLSPSLTSEVQLEQRREGTSWWRIFCCFHESRLEGVGARDGTDKLCFCRPFVVSTFHKSLNGFQLLLPLPQRMFFSSSTFYIS